MPVACGGCWAAAAVSLCRLRWLMDWTGADNPRLAAHVLMCNKNCAE